MGSCVTHWMSQSSFRERVNENSVCVLCVSRCMCCWECVVESLIFRIPAVLLTHSYVMTLHLPQVAVFWFSSFIACYYVICFFKFLIFWFFNPAFILSICLLFLYIFQLTLSSLSSCFLSQHWQLVVPSVQNTQRQCYQATETELTFTVTLWGCFVFALVIVAAICHM